MVRALANAATVDVDYGSTITARMLGFAEPEHFSTESYVLVGPDMISERDVPIEYVTGQVSLVNSFGQPSSKFVIHREKSVAASADLTAATLDVAGAGERLAFYTNFQIYTIASWWAGQQVSQSISIQLQDRRLEAFYHRLDQFERGEWNPDRGTPPNGRAIQNARKILDHLGGQPLTPKKVVAGDARIVVYFTTGEKYSNIEVLNSGLIVLVNSDGHSLPQVKRFELPKLPAIIDQIRAHIA